MKEHAHILISFFIAFIFVTSCKNIQSQSNTSLNEGFKIPNKHINTENNEADEQDTQSVNTSDFYDVLHRVGADIIANYELNEDFFSETLLESHMYFVSTYCEEVKSFLVFPRAQTTFELDKIADENLSIICLRPEPGLEIIFMNGQSIIVGEDIKEIKQ